VVVFFFIKYPINFNNFLSKFTDGGNKDYTCLYKFRVHGKMFDLTNQLSNQNALHDLN